MQVRHYELFLDESGNFTDGRPSLIGGVFCSSGQLTEELALQLLGESLSEVGLDFPESGQVHGTELPKDVFAPFVLSLIRNMLAKEIQPIVFENQERIEIIDPDTTYIHLVAEGITRLFSALSCAGRETALSVTAARRMVEDKQHQSALRAIPREEYLYRIKEHMATAMLRLGVREYRDQWSLDGFRLGSARTEYTLMLADVICHAWYSRYTKFDAQGRTRLEQALGRFHFTVVENGVLAAIARKRSDGAFGEALFLALSELGVAPTSANQERLAYQLEYEVEQILELLAGMPRFGLRQHIDALLVQADYLVVIQKDYERAERVLLQTKKRVLEPLGKRLGSRFAGLDGANLRVASLLLAIHNHRGFVHTLEDVLGSADSALTTLAQRFENLDLVLSYLNRKTVYLNNSYNFGAALEQIDRLIRFHEEIMSLYPVELPQLFGDGLKSDILGKLYGSKVQTLTFLGRKEPEYYAFAREASARAIQEFESPEDVCRQYLYRCQLETDAGQFQAAWEYLVRGTAYREGPLSPDELGAFLRGDEDGRNTFSLAHYCRLMAACVLRGDKGAQDFGEAMAEAWRAHSLDEHPFLMRGFAAHPLEIIKWKLGSCFLAANRVKEGLKRHQEALNICFNDGDSLTLHTIGLGILVEQAGLLLKLGSKHYPQALEQARRQVAKFLNRPELPKAMREYFAHWPRALERPSSSQSLLALSWEVPY